MPLSRREQLRRLQKKMMDHGKEYLAMERKEAKLLKLIRADKRRNPKIAVMQREKTTCPKGHPYAGDNLIVDKSGRRKCRACQRAHDGGNQRWRLSDERNREKGQPGVVDPPS